MSTEELKKFSEAVKNDAALQEELKKIGTDEAAIVDLAKSKGFDIDAAELKAQAENSKGELSEEQLDNVAGGDLTVATVVVDVVVT